MQKPIETAENKNREFGKDITNAFIVAKKSLDQGNNGKLSLLNAKNIKTGDLKTLPVNLKDTKKSQIMSFGNQIKIGGAPKQSFGMNQFKKPFKKSSSMLPNQSTIMETENSKINSISNEMEIDSSYKTKDLSLKAKDSNDSLYNENELICLTENNCNIDNMNYKDVNNNLFHNQDSNHFEYHPEHTDPGHYKLEESYGIMNNQLKQKPFQHTLSENIQEVSEYSHSIFLHLKESELVNPNFYPQPNYMKNQYDINDKMRAILYDWLIDVHLKFKLLPETLFITFNLIDRYLNKVSIPRTKLQLVGVSSMLIACKYEEIYAPEVKDFVYITDKAYTAEEVRAMELDILASLEFNVTFPTPLRFFEFFHHFIKYSNIVFNFAQFLLELSIVDYKMLKYKASLIASSAIYVSTKLLHKENISYNESIEYDLEKLYDLSGYSEEEIKECAKDVCLIYDNSEKTGLLAIRKKYSLPKYDEVSKIKFGK